MISELGFIYVWQRAEAENKCAVFHTICFRQQRTKMNGRMQAAFYNDDIK